MDKQAFMEIAMSRARSFEGNLQKVYKFFESLPRKNEFKPRQSRCNASRTFPKDVRAVVAFPPSPGDC